MKKRLLFFVFFLSLLITACSGAAGGSKEIIMATGGTAGTYFAVGSSMATVLNPALGRNSLSVQATGGSRENIRMLSDRKASLAIVQNDILHYAYTGTNLYEGETDKPRFRAVAGLYDEAVQIVTCDENLNSVADLKGKTVCVGDKGSGGELNARQILEAYGITFDDITVVNSSFAEAADGLGNGSIDAAFIVAGAPTKAVVDLAGKKKIRLLGIDDEHIDSLKKKCDFYTTAVISKDTYSGLSEDAATVCVRATLVASDKMPRDQVYEIVRLLFEKKENIASAHENIRDLSPQNALNGVSIPFHEGAKSYYQEMGIQVN